MEGGMWRRTHRSCMVMGHRRKSIPRSSVHDARETKNDVSQHTVHRTRGRAILRRERGRKIPFSNKIRTKHTLSGQVTTSVSLVHPPQVHQQIDVLATLAGSDPQLPSTESGILGIFTPEAATSAIHCWTNELFVGGTTSRAGKPIVGE